MHYFACKFSKKFSGVIPPDPHCGRGTSSLHLPTARPSAVRVGASRPRLRGPKRRDLNPLRNFFLATPLDMLLHGVGTAAGGRPLTDRGTLSKLRSRHRTLQAARARQPAV
jgi:hypothetical protein